MTGALARRYAAFLVAGLRGWRASPSVPRSEATLRLRSAVPRCARRYAALAGLLLAAAAHAKPVVVLISMDGVRADYPDRDQLPAFERMAREGARAQALVPVFPSITFPAHTAMSTGARTDRHGIVSNHFVSERAGELRYDSTASALEAEPLWAAAERQGVRAATFFWPLLAVDWQGVAPSFRRAPFDEEVPEPEKVMQILAWLDLPEAQRPGLVMSWWHGADGAGHRLGPDAEETRQALREQDVELTRLIQGIDSGLGWGEVTLIVVSDHGMLAPEDVLDARDVLARAGIQGRAINAGGLALVYLREPREASKVAKQLAAAEPRIRAFSRGDLPQGLRFAHPNAGDVVLLSEAPLAFTDAWTQADFWRRASALWGGQVGVHGWDPETTPEMQGIFFALGRGIPHGAKLGRVRGLDVAATVARLLGIDPPAQNEGTAIAGIAEE